MKFTIDKNYFLSGLQKILYIVPNRPKLPILANILIKASKESVELFGTDLDIGLRIKINADIKKTGELCVHGQTLFNILKELSNVAPVEISVKNNKMSLTSENSHFNLTGISGEEFPAIPDQVKKEDGVEISHKLLDDLFKKVNVAVPQTEQRLYNAPSGAMFKLLKSNLEIVGTDGHRMAYVNLKKFEFCKDAECIIPKKFIDMFGKLLQKRDESEESKILFGFSEQFVFLFSDESVFFGRLIENKFPNFNDAVKSSYKNKLIIDKEQLKSSLKRVSVVSSKKEMFVIFSIFPDKLSITSECAEIGDASDELEVQYSGDAFEIGLNPLYLLNFLSVINGDEIEFGFEDAESILIIKDTKDLNSTFLVMPVRL